MDHRLFRFRSAVRLVLGLLCAASLIGAQVPAVQAASAAQVITRVNTTDKVVVLTFDAGADRGNASQILDILAQKGVKATFGMTGVWAQQNPDLIARMVNEGHQLINHTWDHKSFTGYSTGTAPLTSAQRADELQRAQSFIQQTTGYDVRPYFRPPYGDYDQSVLNDLAADGYLYSIMWTVDTLGWNGATASQITTRTLNALTPGEIVLMHVGAESQDAAALPGIIDQVRARGYHFDTVGNLLTPPPAYQYFPETGHTVGNGFLRYWQNHGGLPTFGFPITDEMQENGRTVQYFERARFEYHPENQPPYDILLGLLGRQVAQSQGLLTTAPFQRITAANDANCTYYPETGHRLCFGFRDFWNSHGGLAIYGYPISEEFQQGGYTVQYFERQRLEYHPENTPSWQVEGGLLGSQVYAATH